MGIKEAREAVPVVSFVQERVEALDQDAPVTILDLCSGLGFLGMLLAEILPPARVETIVLIDQAWPLKGQEAPRDAALSAADVAEGVVMDGDDTLESQAGAPTVSQVEAEVEEEHVMDREDAVESRDKAKTKKALPAKRTRTRLNWDHIYNLPWPVTLTTRRSDLKLPSTQVQILSRILEPAPGPVLVLGIHLCGILSIRAVETFNKGPKCVAIALKPCCLPNMEYAKKQISWTLGAHTFAATEVCSRGCYNKNQWKGPVKSTLSVRFNVWADCLHRGMLTQEKRKDRFPLMGEVKNHYQDAYLFGQRPFSLIPPVPSVHSVDLVKQVMEGTTPAEILGVPEDMSNRALSRRWAALAKVLGELNSAEGDAAFERARQAREDMRSVNKAARQSEATVETRCIDVE